MTSSTQNLSSAPTQAPAQPYGAMNQVSSGPAGILYSLSNQLIAIYNKLEGLYSQMTQAETSVQANTINAGATAQRANASAQAWSIGCQAFGALATAVVTAGTTYAGSKSNIENMSTMSTQENQLTNLENINKLTPPPEELNVGDAADLQSPVDQQRAGQMKQGIFSFPEDASSTPAEIATDNQKAVDTMSQADYETFRSSIQEKISSQEKAINTTQGKINYNQNKFSQMSQTIIGGTNILAQGGQAAFTGIAGSHQAAQQVAQGVSQMASSTADNTRQNIGQYYAKVSDAIAAARQGAQAYAQT